VTLATAPTAATAPVIGTITQPTCSVATGSVALSGLPASGTWTVTASPGGTTTTGTGTTTTFSGLTAGTTYTSSCYVKSAGLSSISVYYSTGAFGQTAPGVLTYDFLPNTATTTGLITGYSVIPVGNGWYRISLSQTATITMRLDNCKSSSNDGCHSTLMIQIMFM
jgi:hypothetical protein